MKPFTATFLPLKAFTLAGIWVSGSAAGALVFEAGASSGTSYLKVARTSNPTDAKPGFAAGVLVVTDSLEESTFGSTAWVWPAKGLIGLPRGTAVGAVD